MSDYMLKRNNPPSLFALKAKAERKKVLTGVWERRKVIYSEYIKRVQAANQLQKQS